MFVINIYTIIFNVLLVCYKFEKISILVYLNIFLLILSFCLLFKQIFCIIRYIIFIFNIFFIKRVYKITTFHFSLTKF